MGATAEAKRIGAEVPPTLQPDKKEYSPPLTKNRNQREPYEVPEIPPNANRECAGVG